MLPRQVLCIASLAALVSFSLASCRPASPLVFRNRGKEVGPWCAANERVRIGERVVGTVGFGENKWQSFWVDSAGKEHDPEKLKEQVWSYLERTGDAKKIQDAFSKDGVSSRMIIVSVNPLVVVWESYKETGPRKHVGAPPRYHWVAQVSGFRDLSSKSELRWFSPELKQPPTAISLSPAGTPEISLKNARLKLTRDGEMCKTTRE